MLLIPANHELWRIAKLFELIGEMNVIVAVTHAFHFCSALA